MTAYYGDIISTSGNTVTCKKWDATSTNRWQVTATKYSNTTQYSYSTPTVTGGTINSVTAAATITGSNNRTTNQYTITWKYQDAFNSWNTDTTAVYYYGDTPGTTTPQSGSVPSPETVTKADNSMRNVPLSWDSLATVTGNRTITMGYKTQWNVTSVSGTRCTAYADSSHNTAMTTGWKDNDDPIYWVADTNCAFYESSGTYVTEVVDWIDSNGSWSRTAPLVHVTGGTGTNCTMTSSTGWYQYGEDIEWSANTGYCFDQSDNAVTAYTDAVPGSQTGPTTYKKRFTLTITVDTASHFSAYTVKRGTETLSNGAYIYYGDVLTRSATAASTTYGSWNITSVTAPTFTTTGDATTGNLTVTNKDSNTGTLYYNTSNAAGGTAIASSIAYNGSATKTGLSFNTTYYISTGVSRSRPAYNYSVSSAISGGYSSSVTGNCTVAFTSTRIDPTTNTGTVYSSTVAAKTAARNSYTITWSYQDSYEHWTSTTTTVAYGNTPSAPVTPETVTSGNSRNVPGSWSPSITSCTGDKTYTMGYTRQYNATSYNGTRCSTSAATGWYNSGTSVSWSASSNCAFNSTGTQTTTTTTITSGGEQTCTAGYVNATGFSGTHCSTTASTGWRAYGASISWTADTAYAFDYTNTTTKTTGAVAGTNYCSAPYVKQYTLTISVTNSGYASSYSVSRTSSPYEGAATGTLSNNATIYYGDVLTGSSTAKSQSSTTWGEYGTVTAPTVTSTGDATSGNITVTNKDSETCTLYYQTASSGNSGTSLGTAAYNAARSTTGLSFGTTYYCYASKTVSRSGTYYTYSKGSSNYTGTNSVTGDVTASFSFSRTINNTSSTTTGYSSLTAHTTAARNQYTITWSYLTAYDNTWTPAAGQSGAKTTTYYYGETPSRTDPGNVSNAAGTSRMRSDSWNSLAAVTGNRTITRQYTKQHYIDFTGTRCTPYQSSSYSGTTYADGWYNNSDTAFTIYWKANSNCAFTNAGTDAATKTTSTCTPNQARTPSASADWIYVTISSSNCTANKSTGWNSYNATCTWTANSSYAFDYSGTSTAYTTLTTPGGNYSKTANYGHYVLSLSHCHRKSGTADGYEVVNASSSAYSTVVEADDGWAFDANGTTEKTISAACPGTASASATYFYLTITSGTGCSANKSSGWYNAAQTITWTRSSGYAFDSSGTTTSSRTTSAAPGEYTKAASHGYYTLSLTNCARSSGNAAG